MIIMKKEMIMQRILDDLIKLRVVTEPLSNDILNIIEKNLLKYKVLNVDNINDDYISGIIQSDGSFSLTIRKSKGYIHIVPKFTLRLNKDNKDLILKIKRILGDVGHWSLNKKDNTICYEVTKLKDLDEVIVPFFTKNDLKSNKHLNSFIIFKYIVSIMKRKLHIKDNRLLLDIIILGSKMNDNYLYSEIHDKSINTTHNDDKYKKNMFRYIRYLNKNQQDIVINQSLTKNTELEINNMQHNYNPTPFNTMYLYGLIDGDGSIIIYNSLSKYVRFTISIAQDYTNLTLLKDLYKYFGEIGSITKISNKGYRYDIKSKKDIIEKVIPLLEYKYDDNIHLGVLKGYKLILMKIIWDIKNI